MKTFKSYNPDQVFLLPSALRDSLPAEFAWRENRLGKIRGARAALEQAAKARATEATVDSWAQIIVAAAEWVLICLTHNLLKLFRAGVCLQAGCAA